MSTLNNVDSVANQHGSFKPSVAREGPITHKGVSSTFNFHLSTLVKDAIS